MSRIIQRKKLFQLSPSNSNATLNNYPYNSSVDFVMPTLIDVNEDIENVYISVESAVIPLTFYQINEYNNYLPINLNSAWFNLVIPYGNYNVQTFISYIQAQIPYLSVSYNSTTLGLTFSSTYLFYFNCNTMTCGKVIGIPFKSGYRTASLSGDKYVYSTTPVDFSHSVKSILVKIDDITLFSELETNTTLAFIPVDREPGQIVQYRNYSNLQFPVSSQSVSSFTVRLTDQDGNQLNFNYCQSWAITIVLEVNYYKIPPSRLATLGQMGEASQKHFLEEFLIAESNF